MKDAELKSKIASIKEGLDTCINNPKMDVKETLEAVKFDWLFSQAFTVEQLNEEKDICYNGILDALNLFDEGEQEKGIQTLWKIINLIDNLKKVDKETRKDD